MQTPKSDAEYVAQALLLPLTPESDGEAICGELIARSPLTDKIYDRVWITMRYWHHLQAHAPLEVRKRLMRLTWLPAIIASPCEIWEPDPPDGARYYLSCVHRSDPPEPDSRDFVVVIAKDSELQGGLSADTMYVLKGTRQMNKFRTGRRLWP